MRKSTGIGLAEVEQEREVQGEVLIPSSIFRNRNVAVLEALAQYLKEDAGMTYHQIAVLLNRDDRTIWTCYSRASKKKGQLKGKSK